MSSTAFDYRALPSLSRAWRTVDQIAHGESHVHAVLFVGHKGSGGDVLARTLAKSWLCETGQPGAEGECKGCRAFDSGTNVDFQIVQPYGSGHLIRENQLREVTGSSEAPPVIPILTFFRTRPLMSRHKVVWLREVDRMPSSTANVLLKTLEEPPPYAKLILQTDAVSRIPATILSRCLTVLCPLSTAEELRGVLGTLSAAEELFGEGAPEQVAHVRAHHELYEELLQKMNQIPRISSLAALKMAEDFRTLGEKIGKKLDMQDRQGRAEVLRLLGLWWVAHYPHDAAGQSRIAKAHRAVLAYVNPVPLFDSLFTHLLTQQLHAGTHAIR